MDPQSLLKKKSSRISEAALSDLAPTSSIFLNQSHFSQKTKELKQWRLLACVIWITIINTFFVLVWKAINELAEFLIPTNEQTHIVWALFSFFNLCIFQILALFTQYKTISVHQPSNTVWKEFLRTSHLIFLASHIICVGYFSALCLINIFFYDSYHPSVHVEDTVTPQILQQRITFVLLFSIICATIWSAQYIYHRRYHYFFPSLQQGKWARFKVRVPNAVMRSIPILLFSFIATLSIYLLTSLPFLKNVFGPLFSPILYSVNYNFTIHSWNDGYQFSFLSLSFLWQLFTIGLFLTLLSEFSKHFLEIIHTQAYHFGNLYTLEALADKQSPYIQHLAFLNLHQIAHYLPFNRKFIYEDNNGEAWKYTFNRCCDVIDGITSSLLIKKQQRQQNMLQSNNSNVVVDNNNNNKKKSSNNKSSSSSSKEEEDPFIDLQVQIWAIEAVSALIAKSLQEDVIGVVQSNDSLPTLINSLIACLIALEEYIHYLSTSSLLNSVNIFATSSVLKKPLSPAGKDSNNKNAADQQPSSFVHRLKYFWKVLTMCVDDEPQFNRPKPHVLQLVINNSIYTIVKAFRENLSYFEFPPLYAAKLQSFADWKE